MFNFLPLPSPHYYGLFGPILTGTPAALVHGYLLVMRVVKIELFRVRYRYRFITKLKVPAPLFRSDYYPLVNPI